MRVTKRPVFLGAFLLMLFIAPMVFGPSYASPTMPTEQNMNKDFATSDYLDESNYSIDGFYETTDDNVFYTPDGFYDDAPVLAISGYDDWIDTWVLDAVGWSTFSTQPEYIRFNGEYAIEGFDYFIYAQSGGVDNWGTLEVSDTSTILVNTSTTYQWFNGTYWGEIYDPTTVYLWAECSTEDVLTIDYLELRFHYLPLLDHYYTGGDHYGDSFTNISDWSYESDGNLVAGQYGIGTDGDVMEIWADFQDADNEYVVYEHEFDTAISIETYCEFNFYCESSDIMMYLQIVDSSAATYFVVAGGVSTTMSTGKYYLGTSGIDDIKKVRLRVDDVASAVTGNLSIFWDYLRIGPSDEMGYGHDGSTTLGVEAFNGGSVSSDGDSLSLVSDADGAIFNFTIDTTDTACAINPAYYPFVEVKIHENDVGKDILLRAFFGGTPTTILPKFTTTQSSIRANIRSITGTGYEVFQIFGYDSETIRVKFVKAYAIANFTVTQSALVTVNEYIYVDHTILKFEKESANYMKLDYDPILGLDRDTFNECNMSLTNYELIGPTNFVFWEGANTHTDVNNFSWASTGILNDFQITFYSNNDFILSAIKFIDVHQWRTIDTINMYFDLPEWHLIESVAIIIWMEISTLALDWLLIFVGLIMIPCSTLYLVKGGRTEASWDKVFFAIVAFILGCAFFIGSIM